MSPACVSGLQKFSDRESWVTRKRGIATFGTLELASATSETDSVYRCLAVHREIFNQNELFAGEHGQEVCHLSHGLPTQSGLSSIRGDDT